MTPKPRTAAAIIDFIFKLEDLLKEWQPDKKFPMTWISEKTGTKLPHIVEYFSDIISNSTDVHEPIAYKDVEKALVFLKQRMHVELEARKKRHEKAKEVSFEAYHVTLEKIANLQRSQNWHSAYRTLSYFFSLHEKNLNSEINISICNECLRLAIQANINFQEVARWLKKGVDIALIQLSAPALEDAFELIECYGYFFINESTGKGLKLLKSVIEKIKSHINVFELPEYYRNLLAIPESMKNKDILINSEKDLNI